MTLVTDKVKHNMIQQMLVVVNQDKFMMQRALFHSEQEIYEGSSYMSLVTDKEIHIASSIYIQEQNQQLPFQKGDELVGEEHGADHQVNAV